MACSKKNDGTSIFWLRAIARERVGACAPIDPLINPVVSPIRLPNGNPVVTTIEINNGTYEGPPMGKAKMGSPLEIIMGNSYWGKNNGAYGFSLIEVLIVLALFTLIITLSSIHSTFLIRAVMRTEIEKIKTTCSYLQQIALVTNTPQTLVFDVAAKKYSYNNTHETLPASIDFGAPARALGPPSSPAHPITHPITFTNNQINFYPDGTIKSGTLYLTNKKKDYMYALSIGINQISYIRIYAYDGTWHPL